MLLRALLACLLLVNCVIGADVDSEDIQTLHVASLPRALQQHGDSLQFKFSGENVDPLTLSCDVEILEGKDGLKAVENPIIATGLDHGDGIFTLRIQPVFPEQIKSGSSLTVFCKAQTGHIKVDRVFSEIVNFDKKLLQIVPVTTTVGSKGDIKGDQVSAALDKLGDTHIMHGQGMLAENSGRLTTAYSGTEISVVDPTVEETMGILQNEPVASVEYHKGRVYFTAPIGSRSAYMVLNFTSQQLLDDHYILELRLPEGAEIDWHGYTQLDRVMAGQPKTSLGRVVYGKDDTWVNHHMVDQSMVEECMDNESVFLLANEENMHYTKTNVNNRHNDHNPYYNNRLKMEQDKLGKHTLNICIPILQVQPILTRPSPVTVLQTKDARVLAKSVITTTLARPQQILHDREASPLNTDSIDLAVKKMIFSIPSSVRAGDVGSFSIRAPMSGGTILPKNSLLRIEMLVNSGISLPKLADNMIFSDAAGKTSRSDNIQITKKSIFTTKDNRELYDNNIYTRRSRKAPRGNIKEKVNIINFPQIARDMLNRRSNLVSNHRNVMHTFRQSRSRRRRNIYRYRDSRNVPFDYKLHRRDLPSHNTMHSFRYMDNIVDRLKIQRTPKVHTPPIPTKPVNATLEKSAFDVLGFGNAQCVLTSYRKEQRCQKARYTGEWSEFCHLEDVDTLVSTAHYPQTLLSSRAEIPLRPEPLAFANTTASDNGLYMVLNLEVEDVVDTGDLQAIQCGDVYFPSYEIRTGTVALSIGINAPPKYDSFYTAYFASNYMPPVRPRNSKVQIDIRTFKTSGGKLVDEMIAILPNIPFGLKGSDEIVITMPRGYAMDMTNTAACSLISSEELENSNRTYDDSASDEDEIVLRTPREHMNQEGQPKEAYSPWYIDIDETDDETDLPQSVPLTPWREEVETVDWVMAGGNATKLVQQSDAKLRLPNCNATISHRAQVMRSVDFAAIQTATNVDVSLDTNTTGIQIVKGANQRLILRALRDMDSDDANDQLSTGMSVGTEAWAKRRAKQWPPEDDQIWNTIRNRPFQRTHTMHTLHAAPKHPVKHTSSILYHKDEPNDTNQLTLDANYTALASWDQRIAVRCTGIKLINLSDVDVRGNVTAVVYRGLSPYSSSNIVHTAGFALSILNAELTHTRNENMLLFERILKAARKDSDWTAMVSTATTLKSPSGHLERLALLTQSLLNIAVGSSCDTTNVVNTWCNHPNTLYICTCGWVGTPILHLSMLPRVEATTGAIFMNPNGIAERVWNETTYMLNLPETLQSNITETSKHNITALVNAASPIDDITESSKHNITTLGNTTSPIDDIKEEIPLEDPLISSPMSP